MLQQIKHIWFTPQVNMKQVNFVLTLRNMRKPEGIKKELIKEIGQAKHSKCVI